MFLPYLKYGLQILHIESILYKYFKYLFRILIGFYKENKQKINYGEKKQEKS